MVGGGRVCFLRLIRLKYHLPESATAHLSTYLSPPQTDADHVSMDDWEEQTTANLAYFVRECLHPPQGSATAAAAAAAISSAKASTIKKEVEDTSRLKRMFGSICEKLENGYVIRTPEP